MPGVKTQYKIKLSTKKIIRDRERKNMTTAKQENKSQKGSNKTFLS